MERPWILVFNNKDPMHPEAGGGTLLLHRLLKRLSKMGYDVIQISSRINGRPNYEEIDNVYIYRVGTVSSVFIKSIILAYKIIKTKKSEPQFIIDSALFGISFLTPLFFYKVPIVALFYHLEERVFISELKIKWGNLIGGLLGYSLLLYEQRFLSRIYKNKRTLNITFSKPTYEEMIKKGFSRNNTVWFQEGIEIDKYPIQDKIPKKKQFLYVGRLKKYKGIMDAVKAFHKAIPELPTEFKFHILGDGPYKEIIRRYIEQYKLQNKIILHGFVPHEKKLRMLKESLAVISPSWKEGWATPITEGNIVGTPGLASDAPGVKEATFNGKTGLIYRVRDINDLKEKMIKLVNSPKLVRELGQQGLIYARELNWNVIEKKIVKTIMEFLKINERPNHIIQMR